MSTVTQLKEWADRHAGPRGDLARRVATALEDKSTHAQWSLIDIRREFETRRGNDPWWLRVFSFFSTMSYLSPVFFAWLELKAVFGAYKNVVGNLGEGKSVNFLAFWSGGLPQDGLKYEGTPVATVALVVLLLFVGIFALHFVVTVWESRVDVLDAELENLILDASLEIAKSRAITPEEMASALDGASESLKRGLENLTVAVEEIENIIKAVSNLAESIGGSSGRIEEASKALQQTMQPLSRFGEVAQNAGNTINLATEALTEARTGFIGGVGESIKVLRELNGATSLAASTMEAAKVGIRDAASATKGVADATRDVTQSVSRSFENVVSSISSSSDLIRRVVDGIAHANQQLVMIAQDADSPQIRSFVVEFEETANVMAQSVEVLSRAVEHVSEQLRNWNEGSDVNS